MKWHVHGYKGEAETEAHFQTRAQLTLHGGKLTLPLLFCFKLQHGLSHNYCVVRPQISIWT